MSLQKMLHNSSINPILYIASSRRRNILRNHIYDHRNNHCYNQYHNKYSCHKSFVFLITEINHNYLHNQYGQRGIHEKELFMHLLLPYLIIFIIVLNYAIRKGTKSHRTRNQEFLDRESEANQVRRKDISNLNYISIPDNLPLINSGNDTFDRLVANNPAIKRNYERIQGLRDKKILNLTGISNTDLKLSYGVANLTALTEYDDNFTCLATSISALGHALIDNNDIDDAIAFLEYGISIGSDVSSNYVDLAIIYASRDDTGSIERLREEALLLNSLSRDVILRQLDEILG